MKIREKWAKKVLNLKHWVLQELLDRWDSITPIFFSLVTVPKKLSARVILGSLLKQSRVFVDAFIKHCMPLMDKLFADHRERCIK
jgi:Fanconi anaemia protein FancD2 nuclease